MISMTEFVDRAASVAAATERPVICDADTGFGNAVNVVRTVRELERAGVAGLHLEDQRMPKKCGAFAGKRLISKGEMLGKLHAALDARVDPDFLVIGRTDAINLPGGLDETLERGHAYLEAGCDMILVTVPTDEEQVREICRAFGRRSVLTINESGVSPALPFAEYERLGLKLGLVTISLTFAAITAMRTAAREIRERGEIGTVMARNDDWSSVSPTRRKALDELTQSIRILACNRPWPTSRRCSTPMSSIRPAFGIVFCVLPTNTCTRLCGARTSTQNG